MKLQERKDAIGAHVALMVGARLLAGVLSAAIGLLVPRALGKAEYADYGIAFGIATMLVVITDLGLTSAFARTVAQGSATPRLLRRVGTLRAVAAIGGAFGLGTVGWIMRAVSDADRLGLYLELGGLLVLTSSALGVAMGLLPALRRVRALLALTVAQPLLELVAMTAALAAGYGGAGVLLAGVAAGAVTGTVGLLAVLRSERLRDARTEPATLAAVAKYGRSLFVVAIAFTIFGQLDQLVIYILRGPEEAAGYIAMWRLVTLLHVVGLAAATIVAPRVTNGGPAARALFDGWLATLITGYGLLAAITVATAGTVVPVALGEKYASSAGLLMALGVYTFLLGLAPLVTMAANFLGGAGRRVRIGFATVGVNLVLNLLLVPMLGAYGAAISTSVAFSMYVWLHLRLAHAALGPPVHITADGSQLPRTFTSTWALRSAASAAIGAGVGSAAMRLLEPGLGGVAAVLIGGLLAVGLGALVAWGHPRNAAPRVPVLFERIPARAECERARPDEKGVA